MSRAADDDALIDRILGGDEAAFASLVERHHGSLVRVASLFVSSRATAEEVAQDTWIAVLQGLSAFERRSSLKTWIFRIATNRARSRGVRDARMVPASSLGEPEGDEPVDPSRFTPRGMWGAPPAPWPTPREETPESRLLRSETMAVLEDALAGLPPKQRAVVTLRDIEGLDSDEVCNILDLRETHQRVLLHRARSRLRRALEDHLART